MPELDGCIHVVMCDRVPIGVFLHIDEAAIPAECVLHCRVDDVLTLDEFTNTHPMDIAELAPLDVLMQRAATRGERAAINMLRKALTELREAREENERLQTTLRDVYDSVSVDYPLPGPVFAKVMEALGLAKQ